MGDRPSSSSIVASDGCPVSRIIGDGTALGILHAWNGSSWVAQNDWFGIVSIVDSTYNVLRDVQIALTTNAGATFQSVTLVSALGAGGNGVDRPVSAIDPITGDISIFWRGNGGTGWWIRRERWRQPTAGHIAGSVARAAERIMVAGRHAT